GVCSDGPSSIVNQTTGSLVGKRFSTGLNRPESGTSTPHRNTAWVASIAGSPTGQPRRHHSAATASCDSPSTTAQACGWRGTRRWLPCTLPPAPLPPARPPVPALHTRIQTLLDDHPVVLFMKGEPRAPQCGFPAKAVAALGATGVDYQHVNVLAAPEIREGIKEYGQWPTIPQLYIGGELVGGSDIIEQMANSGDLHTALGMPAPDRTPPSITITPAAAQMLGDAVRNAGDGYALQVEIDPRFNAKLQLAPVDADAIATEAAGLRVQFDLAGAQRARGLTIDWVDDERGRGLVIENPNAPPKVA